MTNYDTWKTTNPDDVYLDREDDDEREDAECHEEMLRWEFVSAAKALLAGPYPLTSKERQALDAVLAVFDWVAPVTSDAAF